MTSSLKINGNIANGVASSLEAEMLATQSRPAKVDF
jgi:hypothetical protein